jgi:hypothetical protein
MEHPPLVLIEWEDSRQPLSGWLRVTDYSPNDACVCLSVGFLLHDGTDTKALAPNVADLGDEQDMQASGIIHIPTRCIRRIAPLELNRGAVTTFPCPSACSTPE